MKIKSIALSLIFTSLIACASTKSNEPLHLMDGSTLFIDNDKVVKMTDKTGSTVDIEKGKMQELANGDYIYIRRDGTVNTMGESKSSHGDNSSNSSSGHSH